MSDFLSPGLRSIASDARERAEREARNAARGAASDARGAANDAQGAVNDTLASARAEANRIAAQLSPAGLLQLLPRGVDYLEIRSRFSPPMFVKVSELVRQYPAPAPAADGTPPERDAAGKPVVKGGGGVSAGGAGAPAAGGEPEGINALKLVKPTVIVHYGDVGRQFLGTSTTYAPGGVAGENDWMWLLAAGGAVVLGLVGAGFYFGHRHGIKVAKR
jgi:hypothetical protein